MTTWIALVRAINLGPRRRVSMSDLRDLTESAGFDAVRTILQSGNLVFRGGRGTTAAVERTLESAAGERLGMPADFFVRTAEEWTAILEQNPFPKAAAHDPGRLIVMCLKRAPGPDTVAALQEAIVGREIFRANGREAYIVYPDGQGRSRLTNALIEKKLGTRGTARNWNTVVKLARLAAK